MVGLVQVATGRGDDALRNGDYGQAEEAYQQSVAEQPANPAPVRALGIVYTKLGEYEAAAQSFQHAIDLDPADANSHFERGLALLHLGRYDAAEASYRQAIKLAPDNIRAHARLGYHLDDQGRTVEAAQEYSIVESAYQVERAAKKPSDDPALYEDYGRVLTAIKRRDEALSAYQRAITLYKEGLKTNPRDPDIYAGLGFIYDDIGDSDTAESNYDQAITLRPKDCISAFNLGVVRERLGKINEAIKAYQLASTILPDDGDVLGALGSVLAKAGRCREAEEACNRAIAANAKNPNAWEALGIALAGQERYSEADNAYRQSLSLDQDEDTAQRYAQMLLNRDCPEDAEAVVIKQMDGDYSWRTIAVRAAIDAAFADKYRDDTYYNDCADHIAEALRKVPATLSRQDRIDLARLYYQRGSAYTMLSDYGKAKADYKKCIELADRTGVVSLSAVRTIRRINSNQRRPLDVPQWLPYVVSLLAVLGMGYGVWLVERGKLSATEFFPIGLGLILVIFAAFSLPSITTLKLGPAEFDKQVVTVTIAPPDKLK